MFKMRLDRMLLVLAFAKKLCCIIAEPTLPELEI
jgi:hypothetical protein